MSIKITVQKGPYQDNGASPWFSPVKVGSASDSPEMKLCFDTGARFIWVTSTECDTQACDWAGRIKFDPDASPSFDWVDQDPKNIDFGPWGKMVAKVGRDLFALNQSSSTIDANFYVTTYYDGSQFIELNWDGGVGIPSGFSPDGFSSNLIVEMLNAGLIQPDEAIMAFHMNPDTRTGIIEIGGYDPSSVIESSQVQIPFVPYIPGIDYVWTTNLDSWKIGNIDVAPKSAMFCHDTGSSQFKGDPAIMNAALFAVLAQYIQTGQYPALELKFGTRQTTRQAGRFVLTEDQYVTLIEAGEGAGNHTTNINPLPGLDNLVLVGSIFLDHLYTVYRWDVQGAPGKYTLSPGVVSMYNKVDGPVIIQN